MTLTRIKHGHYTVNQEHNHVLLLRFLNKVWSRGGGGGCPASALPRAPRSQHVRCRSCMRVLVEDGCHSPSISSPTANCALLLEVPASLGPNPASSPCTFATGTLWEASAATRARWSTTPSSWRRRFCRALLLACTLARLRFGSLLLCSLMSSANLKPHPTQPPFSGTLPARIACP